MTKPSRWIVGLGALALISACVAAPGANVTPGTGSKPAATRQVNPAVVKGTVTAPGGVIASGSGNIIASGGLNYRTQAVAESPLAGATVFLADAGGAPLPGMSAVKTDAHGRYTIPQVPPDYTFVVVVAIKTRDGKDATLQTLARSTALGTTADVSAASTLVTATLTDGHSGLLGSFNQGHFTQAIQATAGALSADALPDWSDRRAVLAAVRALEAEIEALGAAITDLKSEVSSLKQSVADLQKDVADLKKQPTPAPTPTPTPGAVSEPTPTPTPTAAPTATPAPGAYLAGVSVSTLASGLAGPFDVAVAPDGGLMVADSNSNTIRRVDPSSGAVTVAAGVPNTAGVTSGPAATARFSAPRTLAYDAQGRLFIGDIGTHRIRLLDTNGEVSNAVGTGAGGYAEGTGTAAVMNYPYELAFDAQGTMFVAAEKDQYLISVSPSYEVKFLIKPDGGLNKPAGLAISPLDGVLYVASADGHRILKVDREKGLATAYAGGEAGYQDGPLATARFDQPRSLVFDKAGNLYVADAGNRRIRRIAVDGTVTTVAGDGTMGSADGAGNAASFSNPRGLAIDAAGALYLTDFGAGTLRKITLP